jgi:hypothetical protein
VTGLAARFASHDEPALGASIGLGSGAQGAVDVVHEQHEVQGVGRAGLELGYQVKVEVPGPRRFTTKTRVVPVLADWRA